jgi:Icc-related predicted phosphoesterase
MRVHVVSDVHGRADALARAGDGADAVICLGDLLQFLDYADSRRGIFAELFGAGPAGKLITLRTAQRFDEARDFSRQLLAGLGGDPAEHFRAAAARQYAGLFAALPEPAYLTYGNVDIPELWGQHLKPGHHVLDGGRVEVGGIAFGFAGAGLASPYRTPNEISEAAFSAKLDAIAASGPIDVLCTHIPPAVPELLYDTVARRMETGSQALLEAIRRLRPRYAFFGHVHQPLARRVRVGRTECVNVGHFRATRVPFAVDL